MKGSRAVPAKKKHHFVPVCYLSRWCDGSGRIWAYRAEAPTKPLHPVPKEIGFEGHYYSRPKGDGTVDTNTFEDFFGTFETSWPPIVDRIITRRDVNTDMLAIFQFMGLLRVRVPAARDAIEATLRVEVRAAFELIEKKGLLPPPPPSLRGHLDKIQIGIPPWKTLEYMGSMVRGFDVVLRQLGFEIVHLRRDSNMTFLTSDNPVIYCDPRGDSDVVEPYQPSPTGKLELFFPIGPLTLIHGHSDLKSNFDLNGFQHVDIADPLAVTRINRLIARFAYRLMIAQDRSHDGLAVDYAATSPVVTGKTLGFPGGQLAIVTTSFGPKNPKVPWREPD